MQIPGIYVTVRGDISQLDTDLRSARGLVREAANDISDAMGNALKPDQITSGISKIVGRFNELTNYAKVAGKSLDGLGVDLGKFQNLTGMASDQFAKLQSRFLEVQSVQTAERALKDLGTRLQLNTSEIKTMGEQFNLSQASIRKVQEAMGGVASSGKSLGQIIANTFLYSSAYRLLGVIQEMPGVILEASMKMEALRRSFDSIFGNDEGPKQFAYASQMAQRYGKDIEAVADSYKRFSAATNIVGMSGDTTRRVFEAVTQAITKTGGTSEDVSTALGALEHMISKGTVTAEVFRRQFAQHIPGAMKVGAEAMGVTTAEFNRMMKAGEISALDLIPRLVAPLEKMSEGWEKSADTVQANTNRLKNDLKSLADSHYLQQFANDTVKQLDQAVQKTKEATTTIGQLMTVANAPGVADRNSSIQDQASKVNEVDRMSDLDKLDYYNKRLQQLAQDKANATANFNQDSASIFGFIGQWRDSINNTADTNNLQNMKTKLEYVIQLKSALESAEKAAGKGIDVEVNSERAEWLAKQLSEFTNTLYTAHITTEVNADPLLKVMALIDQLNAKSAQGKLNAATANVTSLENPETVNGLQSKLDVANRQLRDALPNSKEAEQASDAAAAASEAIKGRLNALAEAKEQAAKASQELAAQNQSRTDPYYGTNPGEFLGLNDKAGSRVSKYWSDFNKSGVYQKMLDPDPEVARVARAKWAAISQELADGIQKDKEAAAKKAMGPARHAVQVEKLGDTVDNYINKNLSASNSDALGAKFADIDQKAQGLISRAKELSIQGGVSIDQITQKVNTAAAAAKDAAAQSTVEQLFPYLKKDEAIKSFWTEVAKHPDEMAKAARALSTTLGDLEQKVNGVLKYKADLNNLKTTMDYAGSFSDYNTAAKAYQAKSYQDNGEQERKVWQDLETSYDSISSKMLQTRQNMYDRVVQKAKAAGLDEATASTYAQLKSEKDTQAFVAARLNYSSGFGEYAGGRALQDTDVGTKLNKNLAEWEEYYNNLKNLATSFYNEGKTSFTDFLNDAITGNTKKTELAWKDMLAKMRKDLLEALAGMAMAITKEDLFKPLAAGAMNAAIPGSQDQTASRPNASYGLAQSSTGVAALLPAIRQYDLLGLVGGTVGAPSLINAFTSSGGSSDSAGISTFLMGVGSSSSTTASSSGASSSALGLTADQQSLFTMLTTGSNPMSPVDAYTLVTSAGGSSSGFSAISGGGSSEASSSGLSMNDLMQYAGYAKTGYDLLGTSSTLAPGTLNDAGASMYDSEAAALGPDASQADLSTAWSNSLTYQNSVTGAGSSSLMGVLGPAAAAGGIGYLAGGYFEPQGSGASIAGGAGGALAGGLASYSGLGASLAGSDLGASLGLTAGLASTGIGAIVGLGAAALTAALSPSVTTTAPNGNNGITIDMTGNGLNNPNPLWGYTGFTQTTTGSFGSSSTSHFTEPSIADPALAKQWNTTMGSDTASLTSGLNALGMGTSGLDNFSFPEEFDVNSSNLTQAATNVTNAMAMQAIQAAGLATAFNNAAQPGEDYIDEINRISSAYTATNVLAQQAGTSLGNLSGASDEVDQGNWASQVGQLLGGNQGTQAALQTYIASMSKPAVAANTLTADQAQANQAIGLIGNSNVTTSNFWNQYGQALQGQMDPQTVQAWANAASWMAQFDTAEQQAGQAIQQVNNLQIQGLQAQLQAVQSVKVMVDGLDQSVQSAYSSYNSLNNLLTSTLQGIQWNSSLSPNTPQQTYQQQSAYYQQLLGTVQNEGPDSVSYSQDIQKLAAFAQTFLTTSKSVNGMSAAYYTDYNNVTGSLGALQQPIDQQLETLKSQLQDQDQIVNSANEQITQLQLSNTNLQLVNTSIAVLGQDTISGFNNMTDAMSQIAGVVTNLQAQYNLVTILGQTLGLPGFAEGGLFSGGWRIVGENGPELEATGAARIFTFGQTKDLFNSATTSSNSDSRAVALAHKAIMQGNQSTAQGLADVVTGVRGTNRHLAAIHQHNKLMAAKPARMAR